MLHGKINKENLAQTLPVQVHMEAAPAMIRNVNMAFLPALSVFRYQLAPS
jgi:hypothetical protein